MNNDGPQLFSGTLANPLLDTFTNLQLLKESYYSPVLNESFLLNASSANSTAPEPQSYALLLAGLGLVGVAVRRRRCDRA